MARTLIIKDAFGKLALKYYEEFPQEPLSADTREPVENPALVDNMSMDTLLSAILKDKKSSANLIIVSHGNEFGMVMPLYPGEQQRAISENLQVLMGSDTSDQKAKRLSLTPAKVDQLIDKMKEVRKIGLGHVAFRGCKIGMKIFNLTTLRDFLGASLVSGTSVLSAYGFGLPKYEKDKAKFDRLMKQYQGNINIFQGSARVILAIKMNEEDHTSTVFFFLESEDVMLEWLQACVFADATKAHAVAVKNKTPMHWLQHTFPALPLDGVGNSKAAVGYADFIRNSNESQSVP